VNEAATNTSRERPRGVAAVTAPNGSGRDRGRTSNCSARPGRNPSCTEPPKSRLKQSDTLIVMSYAMSTSEMQLGALIGGGFMVVEESETR
jgi:hypothetical protein